MDRIRKLSAMMLVVLFSLSANGCGFLLFGAGAATGAAVADEDNEIEVDND